jgi:hypothetical protein
LSPLKTREARKPVYKRILLKLSGEALMGDKSYGLDPDTVRFMAEEIRKVFKMGVQVAVVIGGGNIFRGVEASLKGMERLRRFTWACCHGNQSLALRTRRADRPPDPRAVRD